MKEKDDKTARPKFHIFFLIRLINSSSEYSDLKRKTLNVFDANALDAGRFFYSTAKPEVQFFNGTIKLDTFINNFAEHSNNKNSAILQGQRNNTMYNTACKSVTRHGDTSNAHQFFIEHSQSCIPHLDDIELQNIWDGAVKSYNNNVINDGNYISPVLFNLHPVLKPDDCL